MKVPPRPSVEKRSWLRGIIEWHLLSGIGGLPRLHDLVCPDRVGIVQLAGNHLLDLVCVWGVDAVHDELGGGTPVSGSVPS